MKVKNKSVTLPSNMAKSVETGQMGDALLDSDNEDDRGKTLEKHPTDKKAKEKKGAKQNDPKQRSRGFAKPQELKSNKKKKEELLSGTPGSAQASASVEPRGANHLTSPQSQSSMAFSVNRDWILPNP